jgi:hypothetical protein
MRHLPYILTGLLLVPSLALASFTDVPEEHEYFAAVQWMQGRGVIQGYEDGTFKPEGDVNRAEALKIILLASEIDVELPDDEGEGAMVKEDLFPDVKAEQWFYPYVEKALELGIVDGYPDGTFRPEQTVNLAEMLKIIYLANEFEPELVTESPFADVDAEAWFAHYASDAKAKNFVDAESDGFLHPDWKATRGLLTEVMYRYSFVESSDSTVFPMALNWPLYQHPSANMSFQIPFDWTLATGSNHELVAWHEDTLYNQTGWDRTTPHSAVVSIFADANEEGLSTNDYFDQVREGLGAYGELKETSTETAEDYQSLLLEYESPYENMRDIVVAFPEGFVTIQATYGKGRLAEQLAEQIKEIHSSVRYSEAPVVPELDLDEVMQEARSNIQQDGFGQLTLEFFEDRELIETDTIGVGTGPVDYFYSEWADVTLKYERSFDVVLDIEDGQTSAF